MTPTPEGRAQQAIDECVHVYLLQQNIEGPPIPGACKDCIAAEIRASRVLRLGVAPIAA